MSKKILLLGATGLLGSRAYLELNDKFTVIPTSRKINNAKKVKLF